MTRTPALEGPARSKRESLLTALRAPGDNTASIRQKTINLLVFKPNGYDRDSWLRKVLPAAWHADTAIASLNGGPSKPEAGKQAAQQDGADDTPVSQQRGRRRRDHHRR